MALNINGTTGISGVDGSASAASIAGTDANTGLSFASDTVNINTGGTTRATVDSNGRLGIGTSSPAVKLHVEDSSAVQARLKSTGGDSKIYVEAPNGSSAQLELFEAGTGGFSLRVGNDNALMFFDDSTERMRIDQAGSTSFFTASGTGAGVFTTDISAGTTYNLIQARYGASSITSNGTQCFFVTTNGNTYNANNVFASGSDLKLKENIVDAKSQWDDIKALKIRNFNFKNDSDKVKMLGVVAQELEAAGMNGLVDEHADIDADGNDLKTVTKSVKYSILYMKAIKALQEAIAKIETLETKVAALEAV